VLGPTDPARLGLLGTYAQGLRDAGRLEEALASFDQIIAAFESIKTNASTLTTTVHNRAGTLRELKRWDESIAGYNRAIAMYDASPGSERKVVSSLVGLGMTFVEAGRPASAVPPLERAIAITAPGRDEGMQRRGRYYLGRARVESRSDLERGLGEVRDARAAMAAAGDDEEVDEVDAWLAKHERH